MADSPPRSDTPDSSSGDDLDAPQVVEEGDAPEPVAVVPEPWGDSRPWWTADIGDGTGPHLAPGTANGTGPQRIPADGSGAHPIPDGTGPHLVIPGGSGAHPIVPGGSGGFPVITDGTGPLPRIPGRPGSGPPAPAKWSRGSKLLLVASAAAVAAVVLMTGVLVFRSDDGGGKKDTRPIGVPASTRVISAGGTAGGLRTDATTPPQMSAAYPFIAGAVKAGGVPIAKHGQAVYGEESVKEVNVLFMGGTGPVGKPADFLQKTQPTTFIAGQDANPGPKGGKSVCGTFAILAETHTYCAWATEDSYGIVASNNPSQNPQFTLMADVMRRIRNDVEKPK